jgi:penicillin-binding protein 1B
MEDRNFYRHQGLDLWRIGGATVANVRAGRIVQGGSTITQQLVKNLFLTPERTLWRKLREAAMALIIEVHREKREILEAYLNEIYLGQRGSVAIHGVAAGARHYFDKSVAELSLAESALLAGMIAAPGRFSPFSDLEAATSRRNLVLGVLHARDEISDGQYQLALTEPLYVVHGRDDPTPAPYFVDWVARQLPEGLDAERLEREGFAVHSTLDADLQRAANDAVQSGLARLEADFPSLVREEAREEAPLQAALIALDPRDGSVLALVGGREWGASQFNRATQARRQPGSVFKPVVALAALGARDGEAPGFTLASPLLDEPLSVETIEGTWEPSNFDGEFRGRVSVRETLERSLNVPTARLGLAIGPERVAETGARLGIESPLRPVPSLALGSSEVTLLEMTRAYSVLASGGQLPRIRGWATVRAADGSVMALSEPNATPVFDAAETWLVTSALLGAVDHGTGAGLAGFDLPVPVAGKTGTTNGFRDAWFIGYTPELVTGVWVGFDDASGLGIPASAAALPIFGRFMESAVPVTSSGRFTRPPQVELVRVNHELGMRAGVGCSGESEEFLPGTAPEGVCSNAGWNQARRGFRWLRERLRDLSTVAAESRARVRSQN